ncbi:MAG TPA: response regulator transcription factor [Gemmatimonadaceae bacterium]|nr:response regulator transcription factor [Gemmatimonadaceae bacterium]
MKRILLVEDNADLAFGLRNNLEIAEYEVLVAADGPSGLQKARTLSPDLVILDLTLPGLDGYRVLRALRDGGSQVPVLILTARTEESDKVMGFRLGADDYVTKPFGVLELVARVEAVLRRAQAHSGEHALPEHERFADVEVRTVARLVTRGGEPVDLSPKEFDLLMALMRRPNQVVTRAELLKDVWGYNASVVSRTIDTHVAELRRKLEPDPASPRHIMTVWKTGYRFIP